MDLIDKFFASSTAIETPILDLISSIAAKEGKPPICVISNVFFGWANDVGKSFETINLSFSTGFACGSLSYFYVWLNLPHRKVDSDEFQVLGFPDNYRFHLTQLHCFVRNAHGTDGWSMFFQARISLSLQ